MPRAKGSQKSAKPKQQSLALPKFGYNLNAEQQAAVTHGEGPLLIVAGAGTGKTTVVTERVAWLIREGKARPDELLVLTFTEKAAAEMEERIDRLLPYGYVDIAVATFHSFGERLLREFGLEIGLDTKFRLLDTAEQWLLLRQNLDQLQLTHYKPQGNPTRFLHALLTHFSRAKDEVIAPEDYVRYAESLQKSSYADEAEKETAEKILEVAKAYQVYESLLRVSGHLDFGDLIVQSLHLLQQRPSVLAQLREKYRYILVDEFQDTNVAQYELVKLIAAPQNNLTVVGDDDQSIYKFRGASISNILEFKKDFPSSAEVSLVHNYRSGQKILDAAYAFIQQNNPNRLEAQLNKASLQGKGSPLAKPISKKLISGSKDPGVIKLFHTASADEEAHAVVADILRLKQDEADFTWNDVAILVRANSHAEPFVRMLESLDVPYQFVAARGLFQQPEVLDLLSYLKMLDNYHESGAFYRVLAMRQFGITPRTIMDLLHHARKTMVSLFEAAEAAESIATITEPQRKKLGALRSMVEKHTLLTSEKSVGQVLYQCMSDLNYLDSFDKDAEAAKIENVAKLYRAVRDFEDRSDAPTVRAFLNELDLILEVGEDPAPVATSEGPEAVKVMTIHGAKGLEFAHVYIVQCVDKRFPTIEKRDAIPLVDALVKEILPTGDAHLEEERRLMYVAMTRAKKTLTFTAAEDYGGARAKKPSRFLIELGLLDKSARSPIVSNAPLPRKLSTSTTKKKSVHKLPAKFSFTQLKAFETCPKQYWYAHILQIPVSGRFTFSFGKSMHATLQKFFELVRASQSPSVDDLLRLYAESWIGEWYDSKSQEAERKAKGEEALRAFYEREHDHFAKPLFLEQTFNVRIGSYTVKGAIDRIDPLGEGVEIVDYKTGKVPKNAKEGLDQLVIYAIAAEDVLHVQPKKLTYYYLEQGEQVSHDVTPEGVQNTKDTVVSMVEKIKKSAFGATPGMHCKFCDFKDICEDRQL